MLKIIDAIWEKQVERIDNGKATKIEKAIFDKKVNFWTKHPKLMNFIDEHQKGVDIACDIAMTAALLNLGYQLGKVGMLKAFNSGVTDAKVALNLVDDGKMLSVVTTCVHKNAIEVATGFKLKDPSDLLKVVNIATEALKNQGVDIHTI
jgi:hypothetical protein